MGWTRDPFDTDEDPETLDPAEATFQAIAAMDEASHLATRLERARAIMVDCARRRTIAEKSVREIRTEYAAAHAELQTAKSLCDTAMATARKLTGFANIDPSHELT
jgi:hypothetical protein